MTNWEQVSRQWGFALLFVLLAPAAFGGQTISGFVKDESNGETLIGANVFLKDTYIGAMTNKSGYYVITDVPVGTVTVVFSYIGYERSEVDTTISLNESVIINVSLKPKTLEMQEVVVVSERELQEEVVKPSTIRITPRKLKSAPQMAEPDLMRTLQMLPGVLTISEFSSGLYIRGGTPDQNLILLDGSEVYNVNHLFGIFSTFDVDAVKEVEVMKGGFPAQYGGRLSSVLAISNMDGNQKEFEGKASIGLVSAKTSLQGPVGKGSWFFSVRRTYIDYILNAAEKMTSGETKETLELIPDYYFYDTHVKLYQDLSHSNKIALTYYQGQDVMKFDVEPFNFIFKWGNKAFTGKWTHIFNEKLFANFYATFSNYHILLEEDDAFVSMHIDNIVDDVTLKADVEYFMSRNHSARIGLAYKHLDSDYSQKYGAFGASIESNGSHGVLYVQDEWSATPLLKLQLGLRLNYYRPNEFVNTFDRVRYRGDDRWDIEPRVGVRYQLTGSTVLKSSWGRYRQYITIVPFGNADFSFMDIWFPSDNSYQPSEAYHYITGVETRLPLDIRFSTELYYKDMPYLYEFDPNVNEVPTGSDLFYAGKGYAYGAEFYFEKNIGKLAGWFSYSLSWSRRTFPELNEGKEFFPKYDRRHYISCVATYPLSSHWKLNFAWTYGTGQAYTQPVSQYEVHLPDRKVPLVVGEQRNRSRLPAYHRLDLGVRYEKQIQKSFLKGWAFYLQIFNVYNRRNIWFRYVDPEERPPEASEIRMLPIVPTIGFEFNF